MSEKKVVLRPLQTETDNQIASQLFARSFAIDNSYWTHHDGLMHQLEKHSGLSGENLWLIEQDGKIIGETSIYTFPIRIGAAILQMGGIGGVCTDPAYRKKGFNKILVNHCLEWMKKINLDISLLSGIKNYYHRFGYAPVVPKYQVQLDSKFCLNLSSTHYTVRKFLPQDIPALKALCNQEFASINGTHARSDEYWEWLILDNSEIYVALNNEKQIEAYIWVKIGEKVEIREAVGQNQAAIFSLLSWLGKMAQERFQAKISGYLHPEQPFTRAALPGCSATFTIKYQHNEGWMARIIQLKSTFQKLEVELNRRLKATIYQNSDESIYFKTDLGEFYLVIKAGELKFVEAVNAPNCAICQISQATLTQMIFGYFSIEDLCNQNLIEASERILPLLKTLFPKSLGYIGKPDYF